MLPARIVRLATTFDLDELVVCSTLFHLGKPSDATAEFCGQLIEGWTHIATATQARIRSAVEQLFNNDAFVRSAFPGSRHLLKDDEKRDAWNSVRRLWSDDDSGNA